MDSRHAGGSGGSESALCWSECQALTRLLKSVKPRLHGGLVQGKPPHAQHARALRFSPSRLSCCHRCHRCPPLQLKPCRTRGCLLAYSSRPIPRSSAPHGCQVTAADSGSAAQRNGAAWGLEAAGWPCSALHFEFCLPVSPPRAAPDPDAPPLRPSCPELQTSST